MIKSKIIEKVKKKLSMKQEPGESNSMRWITDVSDKIDPKEKKRLSKELTKAGFDGNGRFEKIDHGLQKLHEILAKEDLQISEVMSSDKFRADSGSETFTLERKTKDPHKPLPIKKVGIRFAWYLMKSTPVTDTVTKKIYEITAYVAA